MKELSQITACVFDHGLYIPLARHLAKTYKRVLYYSDWETGFPTINGCIIGDGFPEGDIDRCDDIWKLKDEVDVWIFPDIYHAGLQLELESQGRLVWGSRGGDSLEIKREMFHRILGELGMDVPQFTPIMGLTELRNHLMDKEDKFVKISKYRGSMETKKFRNYDLDKGLLDEWEMEFGPAGEQIRYLVFDKIDTELEIGGDTFCIDGKFPSLMLHGLESKDEGYLGAVTKRDEMPDCLQEIFECFTDILKHHHYRNAWSMEVRCVVEEALNYFIDPCCRFPMPGTSAQFNAFSNYAEIIYHGASGELVEPEKNCAFVAECVLTMKGDPWAWGKMRFPKELEDHANLSNCCMIDGAICWPPDEHHEEEIGWLTATGDTIEEVVDKIKELVEFLPEGVSCKNQSLGTLIKEAREAESKNINFTDQEIPRPETAVSVE